MTTLPRYPFPPAGALEPPTELAARRRHEPVSRVIYADTPAWLLTRYGDIRAALTDRRFVPYLPGLLGDGPDADASGVLFVMSGARHARLRRVMSGALSARRVEALRPAVQRLAAAQLVELTQAGAPSDLVSAYAAPLALGVLSE